MDDQALLAAFEACSLERLPHRDHLRIAWLYLRDAPFERAALRFCDNLRRFAAARGKPGLYHATITWAYLALVSERDAAAPAPDFDAFAAANPDLFDHRAALRAYYDQATLDSPAARQAFILPRTASRGVRGEP